MHSLPTVGVFGQYAACRIVGLHFFDLLCRIAVLLFFSACGFFLRLLCVLCCDCWLCFALCQRIFDFCLRSFALARATSPFQSQRAGPQRFLVWVRVWWCCALHKQNAKYPLRGRLTCSLRISKATACRAVSRNTRGGSPHFIGGAFYRRGGLCYGSV